MDSYDCKLSARLNPLAVVVQCTHFPTFDNRMELIEVAHIRQIFTNQEKKIINFKTWISTTCPSVSRILTHVSVAQLYQRRKTNDTGNGYFIIPHAVISFYDIYQKKYKRNDNVHYIAP